MDACLYVVVLALFLYLFKILFIGIQCASIVKKNKDRIIRTNTNNKNKFK